VRFESAGVFEPIGMQPEARCFGLIGLRR
jgi:hypothetical protein